MFLIVLWCLLGLTAVLLWNQRQKKEWPQAREWGMLLAPLALLALPVVTGLAWNGEPPGVLHLVPLGFVVVLLAWNGWLLVRFQRYLPLAVAVVLWTTTAGFLVAVALTRLYAMKSR
ncbi:MAG: hypothetical protein OEV94_00535 [Deltaproteobacteria bacterium]|nr:hypothetical protein [Deltaproteobacteria bacterium]